jgi:hypothetical protein
MKSRLLLFFANLLFFSFVATAQEVSIQNTNPTSLKWYTVTTPHFNVLFPKGFDQQALRVANTLEFIHDPEAASMGSKAKPISVLLQNQSALSNAFVTLSPRRSEFYTMPPQNYNFLGTNDWLSLLASHEYRHVVQYQQSIVGFNKAVYYLLGQNALSLTAFAAAPQWFWEGDAVATETAFTKSGRGRIPNFGLLFRTNMLEGRSFNYQKQYLRSYKHNIPDHYVLGYHMITYLRNKTNDPEVWNKIATRAWTYPFIPFTFSRSIKKETGLNINQLYRQMADSLTHEWTTQVKTIDVTDFELITKRNNETYTDYLYPQVQDDGSVIAVKTGIGDIATIVRLRGGQVIQKFITGPFNDGGMLSIAGQKVVWNEYRYEPRWRVKNYSIVKALDFAGNENKDLSKHSRYAGAAISPDGSKVVTIESSNDYIVKMLVLDYNTGAIVKEFPSTNNNLLQMPRWSPDGKSIVVVRLTKDGKKISKYDFASGTMTDVFDAGNENVGHPVFSADNKYIFYNSPFTGIDNIYALELSSGDRYQVTSSTYGAYNPSLAPKGDWIYYNDQGRNGMEIVRAPFDPSKWKNINDVSPPKEHFYDELVAQEAHHDIMKDVPDKDFPVTKYNRARSLVNVHSWGPFFDTDITQVDLGISSRNLLGTMTVNAGYLFDINERTGSYHAGLSYQGFYPVLDLNVLYGKRETKTSALDKDVKLTWDETTVTGGVRIPLLLTRSKYLASLTLKNWVGYTKVNDFHNLVTKNNQVVYQGDDRLVRINDSLRFIFDRQAGEGSLLYNQATLSYSRVMRQSRRDFNPRFGQLLDLELYNTPFGGDFKGQLAAARVAIYFPGLAKHHSLLFRGGYQLGTSGAEPNRYSFRNRVFRPRGFSYPFDSEFWSFSSNYAAPIWYPDIQLGPMLNIQRLRANVFYDVGHAAGKNYFYADNGVLYSSNAERMYYSVGAEFTVDVNVMRLLPQLDLGVRATMINPNSSTARGFVVEFVLGTLNL